MPKSKQQKPKPVQPKAQIPTILASLRCQRERCRAGLDALQGPAKIDPQPIKLTEAPDKLLAKGKEWTPEFWTAQGYVRNWGDAAVSNNPYFEVLRKEDKDLKLTSFVILCPTFLRRPLSITANGDNYDLAWGSY